MTMLVIETENYEFLCCLLNHAERASLLRIQSSVAILILRDYPNAIFCIFLDVTPPRITRSLRASTPRSVHLRDTKHSNFWVYYLSLKLSTSLYQATYFLALSKTCRDQNLD